MKEMKINKLFQIGKKKHEKTKQKYCETFELSILDTVLMTLHDPSIKFFSENTPSFALFYIAEKLT